MRVGLFLRNLDEEYQINLYRGVRHRAQELGVDVICAQGETIPTGQGVLRAFDLAHQVPLDGALILSSVIIDEGDGRRVGEIAGFLPSIPMVSIGLQVPGMPSVTLKSGGALAKIIRHLVEEHGYRRLLFISGPPLHPDGIARKKDFLSTMRSYASTIQDLSWEVCHGGFFEASGVAEIRKYLGGQPFDAVIAANDTMALGVQRVLAAQEDPRWRRCAVTGYDDISQAQVAHPPLTTVHAPIGDLGALAVDSLVSLIRKDPQLPTRGIASWPVFRRSCGCLNPQPDPALVVSMDKETIQDQLDAVLRRGLESDQWLREANDFGRQMSTVADLKTMLDNFDELLSALHVNSFFLLRDGRLCFERIGGRRSPLPEGGIVMGMTDLFEKRADARWNLCVYHMVTDAGELGTAVYSIDKYSYYHFASALPHVTNALQRIRDRELQEDRNRELESIVQARTQDLTKTNEELREEVRRRKAAETEVLQISELERQRFRLDLQEDICQRIARLSVDVQGSARLPAVDLGTFLEEVGRKLDDTLALARQYADAAYPLELETLGLDAILQALCMAVSGQKGISCTYVSDLGKLAQATGGIQALNLFRIVQAALQHSVHRAATSITVSLAASDGRVVLRVTDNGTRLKTGSAGTKGSEIRSISYRATQLGGHLAISNPPSGGTVVEVVVPGDWGRAGL